MTQPCSLVCPPLPGLGTLPRVAFCLWGPSPCTSCPPTPCSPQERHPSRVVPASVSSDLSSPPHRLRGPLPSPRDSLESFVCSLGLVYALPPRPPSPPPTTSSQQTVVVTACPLTLPWSLAQSLACSGCSVTTCDC